MLTLLENKTFETRTKISYGLFNKSNLGTPSTKLAEPNAAEDCRTTVFLSDALPTSLIGDCRIGSEDEGYLWALERFKVKSSLDMMKALPEVDGLKKALVGSYYPAHQCSLN